MDFITDSLVKKDPFAYNSSEKQKNGEFYRALLEEIRFHYSNNALYRKFCQHKNFDPESFEGDLSDIPPVQVFLKN